jgi:hypothetical protein
MSEKGFNFLLTAFGVVSFCLTYICIGLIYESHEVYFSTLISGVLTPGLPFDDWFYFAHVLLIKSYSWLYATFPHTDWMSCFQYGYLLLAYVVLTGRLTRLASSRPVQMAIVVLTAACFVEHLVYLNFTRVAFLSSFSGLFAVLINQVQGRSTFSSDAFHRLLFTVGALTRPESGLLALLICGMFYAVCLAAGPLTRIVTNGIRVFAMPSAIALFILLWYGLDISRSDEFYKQIEPDLEYELMVRNNIVPVTEMGSTRDSLRYEAVYRGLWGDATTNDVTFLRSLVRDRTWNANWRSYVYGSWYSVSKVFQQCVWPSALTSVFAVLLTVLLWHSAGIKAMRIMAFHLTFHLLLFVIGYKVKMVAHGLSPMLFIVSMLYLSLLIPPVVKADKRLTIAVFAILSACAVLQVRAVYADVQAILSQHHGAITARMQIQTLAAGRNLFLNSETATRFLSSYRPFEVKRPEDFQGVFIFDAFTLNTIGVYRDYLSKVCVCDPTDYRSLFQALNEMKEPVLFAMTEGEMLFLSEYLVHVHGLDICWSKVSELDYGTRVYELGCG